MEKTREYRKPKPINKPQESFNIILAFDNDIKGKENIEKNARAFYTLLHSNSLLFTSLFLRIVTMI
ncbi:hypothetical protein HpCHN52_08100 [Helicobacter pylori]